MKKAYLYFLTFLLIFACAKENKRREVSPFFDPTNNLFENLSKTDLNGFSWMNEAQSYNFDSTQLHISAGPKTDFFVNPEDSSKSASAPYLFKEMKSDFVATTLVQPDFSSIWNACALMMHMDSTHWIKFGFEHSDATGPSIVSVVTRGVSDDCNGVILNDHASIWLKMIRKGNLFAMHWSKDGESYQMARLASMPQQESVKIGLEAQCPDGDGAEHGFLYFSLEEKTVEDLRKGV